MHLQTLKTPALGALLGIAIAVGACSPSTGSATTPATAPAATTGPATSGMPTVNPAATTPAATAEVTTAIVVRDFALDPGSVSIAASSSAGFEITNEGPTVHNVTVRDEAGTVLFGSADLREGESETVIHSIVPGTYVLFCSLPGHESLGIKGTLTVTAP